LAGAGEGRAAFGAVEISVSDLRLEAAGITTVAPLHSGSVGGIVAAGSIDT
jgi:hypothetical protein